MVGSANSTGPMMNSTIAFVTFLRSEAEAAESRSKTLYAQADKLIQDHNLQAHFSSPPNKRGRKTKKSNDNKKRKKQKLTGYTLFMKETNSTVRENNPKLGTSEIVSTVAQMWNEKTDEQKQEWKSKADEINAKANVDEETDKTKPSKGEGDNEEGNEAADTFDEKTSEVV